MTVTAVFVIFAAFALWALSLVVRYRWAIGVERQQLKWFALAAVLAATFLVGQQLSFVGALLGLNRLLGEALLNLLNAATNTALYLAVGIAILRYRLYDIDVLINRTLVYGSLTIFLAVTYVGGVVGLQATLRALTGQEATLASWPPPSRSRPCSARCVGGCKRW